MEVVYLLIGLAAGAAIGWLFARNKSQRISDELVINHPLMTEMRRNLDSLQNELRQERQEKEGKSSELAAAGVRYQALEERLAGHQQELEEMKNQFKLEFQNLANRIFEEKSEKFTQTNKEQISTILTPFRDKLREFEEKVEKTYNEENKERINLKAEIRMLTDLNKQVSAEANNLALALKGDNKTQGNWGELVLERILERSGLREGLEYVTQHSTENQGGDRIKPDVVVNLPDGKHIIIDSKVSLTAYQSMIAAVNDEDRARSLKMHLDSIRSHIRLLGDKNYQTARDLITPDFILLFLPMEAAFSAAIQADPEVYNFAWDRKIVIVSPTTLLATLRTIDNIWKQEKRTRNVEAIAEEGGKLYDKFVGFVEDLLDLGKKLNTTKGAYEEAMKKLYEGTGNLVGRAEKMRKLGARTTKSINPQLVERSQESESGNEPNA